MGQVTGAPSAVKAAGQLVNDAPPLWRPTVAELRVYTSLGWTHPEKAGSGLMNLGNTWYACAF
jgi:hypothetical protein